MIVRKIEINPDKYSQKIWVPKRRKILDVIKFRGRPHIVFEHHSKDDLLFSTGDIEKHIAKSKDIEFENAVILQVPEQRYLTKDRNRYIGHWKTSADITYVYLKPRRK